MDLHCSYHQGPGHDTDHCTALRHAIQDLIDQGLVNLGQPSVTTNPLPAHSTHTTPPSPGDIHHMDLIEDDSIHMLSLDDGLPEPIVLHDSYEIDGVSLIVTRSGKIAQLPPPAVRPFEGATSHEEVRREDDEVLRQLQSTQARISIWSLLASSSTHRDALIQALSQIRVETTTTPKRLIHMMTAGRATCIVFSNDDLPPGGLDHVRPLYITIGCSDRRVPSVLLDNGSALNVCPLATAIALGFAPLDFGPSTQTVRAYDNTKREVMAGAIPSSLHQKVKFIHDGRVITVLSTRDIFAAFEPVLQISHSEDDLLLTGTVVLDMMRGMTFLPGMGLGRRQQGPSEFTAAIDHDTTFGLGFIPTEADYRYMAWLRKERVRARLSHTPFDYLIQPYRMSLADYFVRGSETRPRLEDIDSVVHIDRETDLQHLFHQLQLSDGAPNTSLPMTITPTSPDRASMLSLCFPEEITDDRVIVDPTEMIDGVVPHDEYRNEMDMMTVSQITSIVQLQPVSAFDMFGVSTIKVLEGTRTLPIPELLENDSSLFESIVSPIEGASDPVDPPLSFDVLSGFVSCFDDVSIFDIDDEIAQPGSDRDSFDHDSDPIDVRVSPATRDVEIVDFGTEDQPRELKIGSPLSTDERDRLIHLLRSYLDVFAWSYEDMPGLDPSIVQHHLPTLPHARPVKQKLRRLHPRWSLQVMPFGLKNAGATYQRAATTLFHDMMHRDVEVYVDDMIVKSRGRADHLDALERFFKRIRKFKLRLNPKKCTFGVTSGKLLGHMVSERGIEVDPDKIKAILDMPAPKTEKEIRSFLGRLQYINRFIARLTDICEPIFRPLRKNQPTVWNDDCQFAFKKIKEYLPSPPVLVPPTPGRPLLLYLSVSNMALGSLVWATKRLRHYMTEYSVHLISRLDPLRYLFGRPALTGRLMRWLVLLTEFDIQYVSQKSIKGSIVADHLASLPTYEDGPVDDDFPDEEFVAMTSLSGWSVRLAFSDRHPATNNIIEYEACILGLETALELGIKQMELLVARFDDLRYVHVPRARNRFTDALATLASSVDIPIDVVIRPLLIEMRYAPAYCCLIGETEVQDDLPWYHDIYQFLRFGTYPKVATAKDRRALRHLATRFVICGDTLYRRLADRVCGPHMGGHMLARKIMRTAYFWLTMETDCCQFVQKCPGCQIHGDLIHAPPSELHALTSSWPFSVWGIDIIGKVSPKSSSGHEFILVAIDYFTKWVEAASYARLTSTRVANFIRSHIICRYGVPHELILDRGVHFQAEVDTLLQKYAIRHHRSSAYRPQTNGAVEAANKNIKRILRKMVETSRDWSEKLPFALWAYRTSFRTSIGATPYSLVYGMEVVLPVETEMGSLRVALEKQISKTEWAQARFDQLNLLDERRLRAANHVQVYQRKMARAFKKRVKPRPLQKGDLVLLILRGLIGDPRGKFRPSWSGPYVIRELTPEGAAWLTDLDGNQFFEPTNVDQLKKYYV
ncbi:Retrovirus-related Pol polyprotein from transposon 17.6 [Vitis vinifera]|uniref:Retrovirus-related Pol polyprotein from transposon 17.6 n=1 Tax=Vitis vinifera TaxID=29760 RepID=A0A438HXH7_VITVI|nr:Retrovirus-related Pol polyprotein from transposon 17.6 [Vitis vinifera]